MRSTRRARFFCSILASCAPRRQFRRAGRAVLWPGRLFLGAGAWSPIGASLVLCWWVCWAGEVWGGGGKRGGRRRVGRDAARVGRFMSLLGGRGTVLLGAMLILAGGVDGVWLALDGGDYGGGVPVGVDCDDLSFAVA